MISDVLATRVEPSATPSRYNYFTLYMARKGVVWKLYIDLGRGCEKLLVEILQLLIENYIWTYTSYRRHSFTRVFSPLKRTVS